jgi:BlaI family penicillinase repressor
MKPGVNISAKEWEILKHAWTKPESTASEITRALNTPSGKWHPKTVKTHLGRLVAKGVLNYRKEGRSYRYRAEMTKSECLATLCQKFVNSFFEGSTVCLMSYFREGLAPPGRGRRGASNS